MMECDAVIVGAGPAGGLAAALLARRGWKVVLVERSQWPREKVCGGCVNAEGVRILREAGMAEVLRGGLGLDRFELVAGRQKLELELPGGVAIRRRELDGRLVEAAVAQGVEFLSGASATLLPMRDEGWREVKVGERVVRTSMVLACDGIGGTLLENEKWAKWRVSGRSYFGVAGTIPLSPPTAEVVREGTIHMHLGRGGYVGLTRYGESEVHVAAALGVQAARAAGRPVGKMAEILRGVGVDVLQMKVQGTPLLSRVRNVAGQRVLAIGDACGYVEPFTGEGIAWALRGAVGAVDVLCERPKEVERAWEMKHGEMVRTGWCRVLREVIRWPQGVEAGLAVMRILPVGRGIAGRLAAHIAGSERFLRREFA